ncbi:hypothetical protein AVEN_117382-1 [Araneus ventricosus]|uniref:Uncharacterized protein n=1 Tax=Araneus ventricosus TaxID=182803 RepID=A0A4Y2E3B2_ARAVE|nr:hypothetical protein AVEN_117382-1 [Araneus ventricosus]
MNIGRRLWQGPLINSVEIVCSRQGCLSGGDNELSGAGASVSDRKQINRLSDSCCRFVRFHNVQQKSNPFRDFIHSELVRVSSLTGSCW